MKVHHAAKWTLIEGECVNVMTRFPAERFDAVVTDPPYELGFMNKGWDSSGIAFRPETWAAALRVLKPGGYLLAFGGSRTFHRIACAIEDAGFEMRDTLSWLYGTGFPKSLNVGDGRGTALKPAWEPIILARKPLAGTVAQNIQRWGTGAINIDECRIASKDKLVRPSILRMDNEVLGKGLGAGRQDEPGGRWPANVVLDEEAAAALDARTGTRKSGAWDGNRNAPKTKNTYGAFDGAPEAPRPASEGGASRFFYVAKASRSERDAGCEALPMCSGGEATDREDGSAGVDNPRAGAGRTGGARNIHPTVKPIALMRWLVRLVTPPGGCVLDPFTGSGSTGVATLQEGFSFVGVEREPEYVTIAKCRIEHAAIPDSEEAA